MPWVLVGGGGTAVCYWVQASGTRVRRERAGIKGNEGRRLEDGMLSEGSFVDGKETRDAQTTHPL